MKRMLLFLFLMVSVVAIWYLSISYVTNRFGMPENAAEAGDMFGAINSLFSGLALAGVIFAVWLQTLDVKTNQKNLEKTIRANNASLEIMALSALIQEADCALQRYERWESVDGAGDYNKAKTKVREKLTQHRQQLENKLNEIKIT